MARDKPLTNGEYVSLKGAQCPFCTSTDIEGHEVTINEGKATQPVGCNECDKEWWDEYVLTGYSE